MNPQDYYRTQSAMSDPGAYAYLFDALPDDLDTLCRAVRNIYIHYMSGPVSGYTIPNERKVEADTRKLEGILARVIELDNRPLTEKRPPEQRIVGCCRDAALLLCALLRHKGIPARTRVGFATYINLGQAGFNVDHVVTEMWDEDARRWKLVDAEQNQSLIQHNQITFDVHDVPRDRFIVGGAAWEQVRHGTADADSFGAHPEDHFFRGSWAIRNRLLQDVATLNKTELLLWDTWGWQDYDPALSEDDLHVLDSLAALTQGGDSAFDSLRAVYEQDPRFKAPARVMTYSPVAEAQEVEWA